MIPSLNLLALPQKQELKRMKFLLLMHEILLFIFIAISVGASTILAARIILERKFEEIVRTEIPGAAKIARLNRDIRTINGRLTRLDQLTSSFSARSEVIARIVEKVPPGISWNALIAEQDDKIIISGRAQKREELIQFKEHLLALPLVKTLDLPLSFLVKEKQLDFTIVITVAPAPLARSASL